MVGRMHPSSRPWCDTSKTSTLQNRLVSNATAQSLTRYSQNVHRLTRRSVWLISAHHDGISPRHIIMSLDITELDLRYLNSNIAIRVPFRPATFLNI